MVMFHVEQKYYQFKVIFIIGIKYKSVPRGTLLYFVEQLNFFNKLREFSTLHIYSRKPSIVFYFVGTIRNPGGYDHIFHKGLDRYLDNGWGLQINGSGYHEMWANNEGSYLATSPLATTTIAVAAGRFKLSAAPRYLNTRLNASADGTGVPPNLTHAPTKDACLGAAWYDAGTSSATFFYSGLMYRLLIYSGYHDDATYASTITTLRTLYI